MPPAASTKAITSIRKNVAVAGLRDQMNSALMPNSSNSARP